MQNRSDIKKVIDFCKEQRMTLPKISKIGSNNYDELDEQIILLDYCLEHGRVPFLGNFVEDTTAHAALWVLELNEFYDCVFEEE